MIVQIPQTTVSDSSPSYMRLYRVPNIAAFNEAANYPPPFIDEISDGYNCTRCAGESSYFMLYQRGDIIPLQLRELDRRNADVMSPTQGWRDSVSDISGDWYVQAKILDNDCTTVLSEIVDEFCADWWIGYHDDAGSIQTLFIDTDKLPIGNQGFRVEINFRDAGGGIIDTIYSEPFVVVLCEETITVRADQNGMDYLGRFFNTPSAWHHAGAASSYVPTRFYGWVRLEGNLVYIGNTTEKTYNDANRLVKTTTKEQYQAKLWPIAPYVAKMLASINNAQRITIGNRVFDEASDFDKALESGYMFLSEPIYSVTTTGQSFQCD